MARISGMEGFDDRRFRSAVDLAHEVLRSLDADGKTVEIAGTAIDNTASPARGFDRGREHGMHGPFSAALGAIENVEAAHSTFIRSLPWAPRRSTEYASYCAPPAIQATSAQVPGPWPPWACRA